MEITLFLVTTGFRPVIVARAHKDWTLEDGHWLLTPASTKPPMLSRVCTNDHSASKHPEDAQLEKHPTTRAVSAANTRQMSDFRANPR